MKYTQIPTTTFENIQLNAGIIVDAFNPDSGEVGNILCATTGGVAFADAVEYVDFGEDIDNCPKNMKELKKLDSHAVTLSGTAVTIDATFAKMAAGAADVDSDNAGHIIPRNDILPTDFDEIWWVGDYSDKNTGADAGYMAIKLINALSTGGFALQTSDKGKGNFAFEFTGHYSMDDQDKVPYEIYVKGSDVQPSAGILLDRHKIVMHEGDDDIQLHAEVHPAGSTVTWNVGSSSVATATGGLVHAAGEGNTIVTASITVDGVTYNDTCTVVVEAVEGA